MLFAFKAVFEVNKVQIFSCLGDFIPTECHWTLIFGARHACVHAIIYFFEGKFSKAFDEHQERAEIPMRRGSQFFEAIIGNEMVRVPIPDDLPPLLPTEVEPFSKRLKYAIFPYSHAEPSVMSSSCNPQANIAWT